MTVLKCQGRLVLEKMSLCSTFHEISVMLYKSLNGIQRESIGHSTIMPMNSPPLYHFNSTVHLPPGDLTIRGQSKPEASFLASLASQQLANHGSGKHAMPFLKFARLA
jgi:hypothetical protein